MNFLSNVAQAGAFSLVFTAIVLAAVLVASVFVTSGLVVGLLLTGGNIFAGFAGMLASTWGGMWLTNKVCG
ncbi:MAG: hypothetical protein K2Y39_15945 [Candidatus Obscuribacterales bacterium]|nr:hypothetical protein [Candidatus Obscuribacterales bacterium]